MSTVVIEPHFLPCIEYFCALLPHHQLMLEKHEHFVKQSYRSRCHINTSQGSLMLVLPTAENHGKVTLGAVQLDASPRWRNNHWRTIQSAYQKAPFFEFYGDELRTILFEPHRLLFDFNKSLLSFCLRSLKLNIPITETVSYQKGYPIEVTDLRNAINAKKHHSRRNFYHPIPYPQVFGSAFVANSSVIDLLFCEGPNATRIIKTSGLLLNK
ncbi:MAG: WbqC family protein [Cytophagales bacterium]